MSTKAIICVKSFRIRSFSCPYFPAFGLNLERYGVSLRIQSECGEMWTRKTPNKDTFLAVYDMDNDNKLAANLVKSNCVTLPDIAGGILCYQRFVFYFWCKAETRRIHLRVLFTSSWFLIWKAYEHIKLLAESQKKNVWIELFRPERKGSFYVLK